MSRPWIALTVGDPAGIGPEIVGACLQAGLEPRMRILVLGPLELRPPEVRPLDLPSNPSFEEVPDPEQFSALREQLRSTSESVLWLPTAAAEPWEMGKHQAAGGRIALAALRVGAQLAQRGVVDALVTAPVSKEAMRAAGVVAEGQTQLLAEWAGAPHVDMLAIAGRLRVSLLTRHLPIRDALAVICAGGADPVVEHLGRLARGLELLGIDRPRLALAGLNPHAGEGGLLGSEEQDFLIPAVERAREELGLEITGPVPPDTVFLQASQGRFDAVLALYHDQGFIPVKFAAPMQALTVLLGLPYLRVSPAHGTAFDIAGRGVADASNLELALERAAEWAMLRGARTSC